MKSRKHSYDLVVTFCQQANFKPLCLPIIHHVLNVLQSPILIHSTDTDFSWTNPLGQLLPIVLLRELMNSFPESSFTSHIITWRIFKCQEVREDIWESTSLLPLLTIHKNFEENKLLLLLMSSGYSPCYLTMSYVPWERWPWLAVFSSIWIPKGIPPFMLLKDKRSSCFSSTPGSLLFTKSLNHLLLF